MPSPGQWRLTIVSRTEAALAQRRERENCRPRISGEREGQRKMSRMKRRSRRDDGDLMEGKAEEVTVGNVLSKSEDSARTKSMAQFPVPCQKNVQMHATIGPSMR